MVPAAQWPLANEIGVLMTAASQSATGLYLFFACWFAAVLVFGFALYYVWDRLAKRAEQAGRSVDGTNES